MAELSPLRRRMIEDMTVRNMSPATQRSYISAVSKFSRYFGRSPERLDLEDVRAFQVHLVSTGISWPGLNQIVCALRSFYGVTLGEAEVPERIPARSWRAARRRWAAMSRPVMIAARDASPTFRAAIGIVRSVRTRRERSGWPTARPNCCRFPISTSCARCPRRSPPSPSTTRPPSMRCCSRAPSRP